MEESKRLKTKGGIGSESADTTRVLGPYRKLALKVVLQACKDLHRFQTTKNPTNSVNAYGRSAKHWIFMSRDEDEPFSFINCCERFGWPPAVIRRKIRNDLAAIVRRAEAF